MDLTVLETLYPLLAERVDLRLLMGLVGPGSSPDVLESLGLACKTGPVSLASALLLDWGGAGGCWAPALPPALPCSVTLCASWGVGFVV